MKQRIQPLLERWQILSFGQKIMVGTILVALAFSSTFLFQQVQNDYDVLYANLSLEDASAIAAKLRDEKRSFKLANDGTTILVPSAQKNSLILETANELKSEKTVNLTQIPPVVSGAVQKEWIKKLNTTAIISVLRSMRGISNAQVIVSQPEKNLFVDDQEPPTASVMLMVEPGFRLHEAQVKTIKNLVSHAVPGLKPDHVAIADNSGNSLEGPGSFGGGGVLSNADIRRDKFESETGKKVLKVLSPVVGKENVVVSVSSVLNFDQAQTRIHRIMPSGGSSEAPTGVAVSRQEQTEEYAGQKKSETGGEPGVTGNAAPSYPAADNKGSGSSSGDYRMNKATTNFELSKEDKTVVYAPGTVERMTVAVVLNKVLTAQQTDEIRELVANAAGVDFARGDSIDIKGFQFSQPPEGQEAGVADALQGDQDKAFWLHLATIITIGLMVIVALVVFYMLIKQPLEGELMADSDDESIYPAAIAAAGTDAVLEAVEEEPAMIEADLDPELEHMRDAINNAISAEPDEAARLLVTYMKDL